MGKIFLKEKDPELNRLREKALYIARQAGAESSAIEKGGIYTYSYNLLGRRHSTKFEYDDLKIELYERRDAKDAPFEDPKVHIFVKQPFRAVPIFKGFKNTYSWSHDQRTSWHNLSHVTETVTDNINLRNYMAEQIDRLYSTFHKLVEEKKMTPEKIRAMPKEEFEKILGEYSPDYKKQKK